MTYHFTHSQTMIASSITGKNFTVGIAIDVDMGLLELRSDEVQNLNIEDSRIVFFSTTSSRTVRREEVSAYSHVFEAVLSCSVSANLCSNQGGLSIFSSSNACPTYYFDLVMHMTSSRS